jgi:heme A synthase
VISLAVVLLVVAAVAGGWFAHKHASPRYDLSPRPTPPARPRRVVLVRRPYDYEKEDR